MMRFREVREVERRFESYPLARKANEAEAERLHEEVARDRDEALARYREACDFWDSLMRA